MSIQKNNTGMQSYTNEAIALAIQGRWQEAVTLNKTILELSPEDVDACNRLGRALMELGKYEEAKESYSHAIELDRYNSIARKNLDRLSHLAKLPPAPKGDRKLSLDIFIGEANKVSVVNLIRLAPKEVIARMAPGEEVNLQVEEQRLLVRDGHGDYLGEVEPKYGLRLAKLIRGGNKYVAAISSLADNKVNVIIREVYQHPSQAGRLSFPHKEKDSFRPYARRNLLRHEPEEDEQIDDIEESTEEEGEGFTLVDIYDSPIIDEGQKRPMMSEEDGNRNS
jgi:tetratricopeptide (TPR) repeat protein